MMAKFVSIVGPDHQHSLVDAATFSSYSRNARLERELVIWLTKEVSHKLSLSFRAGTSSWLIQIAPNQPVTGSRVFPLTCPLGFLRPELMATIFQPNSRICVNERCKLTNFLISELKKSWNSFSPLPIENNHSNTLTSNRSIPVEEINPQLDRIPRTDRHCLGNILMFIIIVINCLLPEIMRAVGSLVVRASDSRPENLGSMPVAAKHPPSTHGSRCRNCGGGDRGRVAIYRPFGELRRAKIVLSPEPSIPVAKILPHPIGFLLSKPLLLPTKPCFQHKAPSPPDKEQRDATSSQPSGYGLTI
ncbi:hypothetical protein TNCV_979431 [Trichonephila clavipes]|nr:hypothetical protein TNCV_979431 [Trichonephila clavipes]